MERPGPSIWQLLRWRRCCPKVPSGPCSRQESGPRVPARSRRARCNFTDTPRVQMRLGSPTSNPFHSVRPDSHRTSRTQTARRRRYRAVWAGCDPGLGGALQPPGGRSGRRCRGGAVAGGAPPLCPRGVGGPRPPPVGAAGCHSGDVTIRLCERCKHSGGRVCVCEWRGGAPPRPPAPPRRPQGGTEPPGGGVRRAPGCFPARMVAARKVASLEQGMM